MTFALITEGASEHHIVKKIVSAYFKELEPEFKQIQPLLSNSGKQDGTGGWNEVLKYCSREDELKNIFVDNDYLIIQIDTDQSAQNPFSVEHTESGKKKSDEKLIEDVQKRLMQEIPLVIKEKFSGRIFFAVCIHTSECWLLPLHVAETKKAQISAKVNCISKLNIELKRKGLNTISEKEKNSPNSVNAYKVAMSGWRKRTDIEKSAKKQMSLAFFLNQLSVINI
jgi:hypothetical protein